MPVAAELYYSLSDNGAKNKIPVVLIHGAGGSHLFWPPQIRRLPGYCIYAIDLPGHGKSGGTGQQTISGYAQAVLTWLESIGWHRAVFVGHSMGGAIAITIALEHPEQVVGLGLIGTAARLRVAPLLLESTSSPTTFLNAIDTIIAWSFSPQSPARLIESVTKRMAEMRPSVLHGDFLACDTFDETQRISQIRQPTLIICGADDRMTPLRNSQFLADNLPAARLEIIPNAGHMVMLEQPAQVAAALEDFLLRSCLF